MNNGIPEQLMQNMLLELERCGFQPLGKLVAQGSGITGKALSADGTTWAEIDMPQSGLRNSLRHLLKTAGLRGAGRTAQFTTEISNRCYLVTTTATMASAPGLRVERLRPETPVGIVALRHMQRIETYLRDRHPAKALIHTCADEIAAAQQRARACRTPPAAHAERPLTVETLQQLSVPPRLARLIAGEFAETAEPLPR